MKKYINIIFIIVFVINILILDITIFNMNKTLNRVDYEVFKDKVELSNDETLCVGAYVNENDVNSNEYHIYNDKKNNFEIWHREDGKKIGNIIGTYTIDGNNLDVEYKEDSFSESDTIQKISVVQNKDCSFITIDGVKYSKVEE